MTLNYGKKIPPHLIYAALAVLFLMLMTIANETLRHYRIDMTENNAYTLSDGTRTLLAKIDQPINLYLFFSEEASRNYAYLRKYHTRVREVLEEFTLHADGKLKLHLVDPEPFSEEEDRAAAFGLQAVPLQGSADSLYFGVAGTNAVGHVEKIPFLDSRRETFLEYDLDKMLYTLMDPDKPVLGLMTTLPMYPTGVPLPGTGGSTEGWVMTGQLEQLFEVKQVFDDADRIDPEIDILMVVHPHDLSDATMYAVDQFVVKGGKALFFVDPHAEIARLPMPPAGGNMMQPPSNMSSSLNRLFRKWGFEVPEGTVVGDVDNALQTAAPGQAPQRNIAMLGYRGANIDRGDVVTARLERLNLGVASHIKVLDESKIKMTPLVWSSKQSALLPASYMQFMGNPSLFLQGFQPTGEEYPVIARLQGQVASAFDEAPQAEKSDDDEEGEEKDEKPAAPLPPHIAQSDAEANMLVVADVDLLGDQMWVQIASFLNQKILQPIASNRDLVVNAVENMAGDEALIGVRGRAVFSRPFTRIIEIQRQADLKYRKTDEALQAKLRSTEQKLQELQNRRDDNTSTILTPEQQAEIAKFQNQLIQTRRDLRDVKHKLAKDIDALNDRLRLINIGLVPFLITLGAGVFAWMRNRRSTTHKQPS